MIYAALDLTFLLLVNNTTKVDWAPGQGAAQPWDPDICASYCNWCVCVRVCVRACARARRRCAVGRARRSVCRALLHIIFTCLPARCTAAAHTPCVPLCVRVLLCLHSARTDTLKKTNKTQNRQQKNSWPGSKYFGNSRYCALCTNQQSSAVVRILRALHCAQSILELPLFCVYPTTPSPPLPRPHSLPTTGSSFSYPSTFFSST